MIQKITQCHLNDFKEIVPDTNVNTKEVHLFWTGGWDSTFRLLQLLIQQKKKVQPLYIVDPARNSLGVEIQSMNKLMKSIKEKYPYTELLLSPTRFVNIESIDPDDEITRAYQFLKQKVPLGHQYDWLARFCKQYEYCSVEIAVENVDGNNGRSESSKLVRKFIDNNFLDKIGEHSKKESEIYSTSKILFRYFKFPVINLSKREMFRLSKQNKWLPIMGKTWFCYQPLYVPFSGQTPCGICITCRHQIKYGLDWRVPLYVKLFQKIRGFKNKIVRFMD